MIQSNSDLRELSAEVGSKYGLTMGSTFHPFKEFKATWRKMGGVLEVEVSDYFKNAPDAVVADYLGIVAEGALKMPKRDYCQEFKAYLASPEFLKQNQPLYIRRSKNLTESGKGRFYDLDAMYASLVSRGLSQPVPNVRISWTLRPNRTRVGYTSPIMNTIAISSLLDRENVPAFVTEYVLYHELLHHEQPLIRGQRAHDVLFKMKEAQYPRAAEAERCLTQIAVNAKYIKS